MSAVIRRLSPKCSVVVFSIFCLVGTAQAGSFNVVPAEFDPGKSRLVSAQWAKGVGCPTAALAFIDDPATPSEYDPVPTPYTDPACETGDPQDKSGEGLVLVKTGPTVNFASATADLKGIKGTQLTELGYDIRKKDVPPDAAGSHCGAGAPRFNVVIAGTTFFIGCNSPAPTSTSVGTGWVRLLWGPGSIPAYGPSGLTYLAAPVVESISIVFDEGQDVSGGPDQFGMAVLDNINVNGTLVGRGPAGGK